MPKNLVIVESPAKAKTIEKYLGKDFRVLSSVGHIRKDTKVDPENDFNVIYEIDDNHREIVNELKKEAKKADTIWLATDEDREGESISWHLLEVLNLPKNTHRITFHEITESALKEAIKNPRTVDMNMVSSQQARQTLDMLVGFDLSGVVRKKVPGAISAGRVQSPALRLIVEREREIEKYENKSFFKVTGEFAPKTTEDTSFLAALEKTKVPSEEDAKRLLESFKGQKWTVTSVEKTEGTKANPVPFATAALQIEANAKLGFSSSTTMRAAQGLYQAGHITYHRTDSLNLSKQALASIASYIEKEYGKEYLKVRNFKTKSAGAQEAHEAIRPTHIEKVTAGANDFEKKLYQLIRSRTLATQMANAKVAKTTIVIGNLGGSFAGGTERGSASSSAKTPVATAPWDAEGRRPTGVLDAPRERASQVTPMPELQFIAKGEIVIFDGFLKVYGNAKDTELPVLKQGDELQMLQIIARETFERPPARYTEGSLVKKLEELGIGRPSTYASIMSAIQTRGYVKKGESEGDPREIKEIVLSNKRPGKDGPCLSARTVTEKSGATKGKLLPTPVGELVSDFLTDNFNQVVDYGFTAEIETDLDKIAEAKLDRVKMLKDFYGPFSKLVKNSDSVDRYNNATSLGIDPETKEPIYAKIGKNGGFIQLGDNEKETGKKPRFAPLPEGKTVKTVTFDEALKQLALPALPRILGKAKDGTEIIAAAGPFGPYLKCGKYNIPIKGEDPYTIDLKTAEPLYQKKIDSIISDWGDISIVIGAYGPYVKGPGRFNNVKIPKDTDPKKITQEEAEKMLAEKPKTRGRKARTSKATARGSSRHPAHKTARKKSKS
ncbi:type I DNA topoisomerase [Candidatus Saccharibacteria bacterium]|nr:type I DNA topoisomerase [Candidatus Saccharibacteria bacterium]